MCTDSSQMRCKYKKINDLQGQAPPPSGTLRACVDAHWVIPSRPRPAGRKSGWPLDRSTLYSTVTSFVDPKDVKEKPTSGCYIQGLYLEGAAWDVAKGCLVTSKPKVLHVELPILRIIPIEVHKLKLQNTFRSPVYTTSNRRDAMGVGLVFEADLATHEHTSLWTLQGVCLTLNSS